MLNSFKLNDGPQSGEISQEALIDDDLSEGFDQNDNIFVQYDSTDCGHSFSWKANRPSLCKEYKQALLCTFGMQFFGLFMGSLVAVLTYLDISTGHLCQGVL